MADTLDRFQIVAKKDLYPSQLSGGQQQLVGIARAVIHKPPLLLADEPTGNLHSGQAKEIMELFRELNQQGTTIVQVTHSEANAAYGTRTIQLRDGWLVADTANPVSAPLGGGQRIVSSSSGIRSKWRSRRHLFLCAVFRWRGIAAHEYGSAAMRIRATASAAIAASARDSAAVLRYAKVAQSAQCL